MIAPSSLSVKDVKSIDLTSAPKLKENTIFAINQIAKQIMMTKNESTPTTKRVLKASTFFKYTRNI
jgi:hypothetical protein